MVFYPESTHYEKTSLSDLQGAWESFRGTILSLHPFPGSDRIIFHTNEAMSWENVRNLMNMKNIYVLIRNIALKATQSETIEDDLNQIKDCLDEAIKECGNI